MTLQDAILEIYEDTNEQDDLSPYTAGVFDLASAGAQKILGVLERGVKVLATWRFSNGRRARFRCLEAEGVGTVALLRGVTTTPLASYPTKTLQLGAGLNGAGNAYQKRLLTLDGTTYFIVASTATTVTLHTEVPSVPVSSAFTIASRDYVRADLTLSEDVIEYISFFDIANNLTLEKAPAVERFQAQSFDAGTPARWTLLGATVRFDLFPDSDLSYLVRYVRFPTVGALATDPVTELPDMVHESLCAWAKYWALFRDGDFTGAAESWNLFLRLYSAVRFEDDMGQDYGNPIASIDR